MKNLLSIVIVMLTIGCSEDYTGFKDVVEKHHLIEPNGFEREYMNYEIHYKLPEQFNVEKYLESGSCTLDDMTFSFLHFANPTQQTINVPDTADHGWIIPENMRYGDDSLRFQVELPMYYQYEDTSWHRVNEEWFGSDEITETAVAKLKSESRSIIVNKLPDDLLKNDGRFKVMEYRHGSRATNQILAFNYTHPASFTLEYEYPLKDSTKHREIMRKILLSFSFKCEDSKLKPKNTESNTP